MPSSDPRFTIHNVSVQQAESSFANPKKKLSHSTKATPSGRTAGVALPIKAREKLSAGVGFIAGFRVGR